MRALPLLLLAALAGAAEPEAPAGKQVDQAKLNALYDTAFAHYKDKDYARALQTWNDVLRLDPEQKTARRMIGEVREEINRENRKKLERVYARLQAGEYPRALADLQLLIEEDESHPRYRDLQTGLEEVAAIVPDPVPTSHAWRMARIGVESALGRKRNVRLAYTAFRYAAEIDATDEKLRRLNEWLLSRAPELGGADAVTPGMSLMEYKHFVALDQIYDGKYHLAIDTLNEILALEPLDVLALKRLGSAYFSLHRRDKARQAWSRALHLAPEDPQLKKFLKKLNSGATLQN